MLSTIFAFAISQQQTAQFVTLSQLSNLSTEQVIDRAEFHFTRNDWESSSIAYQVLIDRSPRNSTYRFRYGKSLIELKQYNKSISPLRFARDSQFNLSECNFLLSRAYAGLKMKDIAMTYLEESVERGFEDFQAIENASELAILKDNTQFHQLCELIQFPAVKKPGGRLLDFLVGNWSFNSDDGFPAGQSTVFKTEKGYQVKEIWIDGNGEQNITTFHLQIQASTWTYDFESSDGRRGEGKINLITNGIEREGQVYYPDGGLQFVKEAFTRQPDSTIMISIMHSYDHGQTWTEIASGKLASISAPKPMPRSDGKSGSNAFHQIATVNSPTDSKQFSSVGN